MTRGRDQDRDQGRDGATTASNGANMGGYGRGKGRQQRDRGLGHHSNSAGNFSTQNEQNDNQIDQSVLRMSRAQFQREEEERKRQATVANLKKQYEEYEQVI